MRRVVADAPGRPDPSPAARVMPPGAVSAVTSIPELRQELDEIDVLIVGLLASRVAKVAEIAVTKSEQAIAVRDLQREQDVLSRVEEAAAHVQVPTELVRRVFCAILEHSVEYQRTLVRPPA